MVRNSGPHGTGKRVIAAFHRANGATQVMAAQQAGVHVNTISRWERGEDVAYWSEFADAKQELRRLTWAEAWLTTRNLLRSADENIALRAAHEIIVSVDRDLPQRIEHSGVDGDGPIRIVVERPAPMDPEDDDGT